MIRKRLYLQIYLTVVMSLVLVVVITALSFWMADRDDDSPRFKETVGTFVMNALPEATLPKEQQATGVLNLMKGIEVDLSLFTKDGELIVSKGEGFDPPEDLKSTEVWDRHRSNNGWVVRLRDGRWLVIGDADEHNPLGALIKFLLTLSSIALGIGIVSYPFVRKLTKRLEKLQDGVEKVGAGDLSFRVEVKGKDEIAVLAKSFNHSTEQIERLVTTHKTLLANASHELRTPLSRIRLGLEMYQDTHDEKRLMALKSDILELDALIEEIMLMSRLDNNSAQMTFEDVDLNEIVKDEAAHYPNVTIVGSVAEISGNSKLLRRTVRNLLANAFKHGAPPVDILLEEDKDMIHFTASDNGSGVPLEERSKIFERFYRGPDRQNVEGYGLGLPLVKQIIDAHGGQIEVLARDGFSIKVSLKSRQDDKAKS